MQSVVGAESWALQMDSWHPIPTQEDPSAPQRDHSAPQHDHSAPEHDLYALQEDLAIDGYSNDSLLLLLQDQPASKLNSITNNKSIVQIMEDEPCTMLAAGDYPGQDVQQKMGDGTKCTGPTLTVLILLFVLLPILYLIMHLMHRL